MQEKMGFVFDLDGTLINSAKIQKTIEKAIYKKFNIKYSEELDKEIEDLVFEILHGENRKNLSTRIMWQIFKNRW